MKKRQGMGYGLLILAGLFLWNPIVGMVDVLPDLIGYILLFAGLSMVADLQEEIFEARERFRAVAWVALGEAAAQLFIRFFLSVTTSSQDLYGQNTPTWILLFSFVITVLECYFLIPAYRSLFRGLGRLAEARNAAHLTATPRAGARYDRMAVFSIVFVIGKNLLSLLPEFAVLSAQGYREGTSAADWYVYINAIRALAFLPALILTAVWLVAWIRLFTAAKKDVDFQSAIRKEYEEKILPDHGLLISRRARLSFLLARLAAAMLPTFMLLWEGVGEAQSRFGTELLPDFAAALFLTVSIYLLGIFDRIRKSEIWIGALAICAGAVDWVLCTVYYQQYTSLDGRYLSNAVLSYRILTVTTIISSLLAAALFALFLFRVLRLIQTECSGTSVKDFTGRLVWLFVLLTGITAGKIADRILRPWTGWVWWIPLLLTVVFVLILSSVFADLSSVIATRYPSQKEEQASAE